MLFPPQAWMASNHDIFRIPTGLKYSWARELIADAISSGTDRTTERHVLGNIDGDEPIRSIKDFVPNEPKTPAYAQEDR